MYKEVHVNGLRHDAMERAGLPVPEFKVTQTGHRYMPNVKLPAEFGTNGHLISLEDWRTGRRYDVLVLTSRQAAVQAPRSIRPHRVFCRCQFCGKLIPAGRLLQHERACEHPTSAALHRWAMGGV